MNKFLKGMSIVSVMLGCPLNAGAQNNKEVREEAKKEGFMKRAFRDMKESARLQRQIDRANFQAVKLETKAFYQEQKILSKPSVRTAAEKERMQKELEAANQRVAEAQVKVQATKK